jgi:DNA polymerase (family 10)
MLSTELVHTATAGPRPLQLDRKAQTDRLLRAISNPHTTILDHMTGRQLQRRPGYDIDVERVLRACARHAVAVRSTPTHGAWTSTGAGTRPRSISAAS